MGRPVLLRAIDIAEYLSITLPSCAVAWPAKAPLFQNHSDCATGILQKLINPILMIFAESVPVLQYHRE